MRQSTPLVQLQITVFSQQNPRTQTKKKAMFFYSTIASCKCFFFLLFINKKQCKSCVVFYSILLVFRKKRETNFVEQQECLCNKNPKPFVTNEHFSLSKNTKAKSKKEKQQQTVKMNRITVMNPIMSPHPTAHPNTTTRSKWLQMHKLRIQLDSWMKITTKTNMAMVMSSVRPPHRWPLRAL